MTISERLRQNRFTLAMAALLLGYVAVTQFGLFQGTHPLTGQPAPVFATEDLDGEPIDLAAHAGKDVVVLDFWSTSCPPCRKGLPMVQDIAGEFKGKPLAVYAISIMDEPGRVRQFLGSAGVTLPVAIDGFGDLADLYGVRGIPHTVVIGKDGVVRSVHVGLGGFERWLRGEVTAALGEAGVPPAEEA